MHITINATESRTEIPDCMMLEGIREAAFEDGNLSALAKLILQGWPSRKAEVQKELKPYCSNHGWDCHQRKKNHHTYTTTK